VYAQAIGTKCEYFATGFIGDGLGKISRQADAPNKRLYENIQPRKYHFTGGA
jgi:hypothetical protein